MGKETRVAIYARISRDSGGEGLGVARQLADCEAYSKKQGFTIVEKLVDNDISASGLKRRPSYLRLKEMMEQGEVDRVLVYAMDRLHRSMPELVEYIALCQQTGVGIHSLTGGTVNLATADGRLQAQILGAVASAELEKTRERIQRKMRDLAETGAWTQRRCYGYTAEGPEIVEEEAEIIREMADRVLEGEGLNAIARDLEARGITTIGSATWRASTISTILKSGRIAGHREHHGKIVARDAWPAIISQETHYRLRARFAPGQGRGPKPGGARKHLLTGILRCGKCGGRMVFVKNGRTRTPSYRCPKVQGNTNCGGLSIIAEPLEELLAEMVFLAHDRLDDVKQKDSAASLAEREDKREELETRKDELAKAFATGVVDMADWLTAKKVIEDQLSSLPVTQLQSTRTTMTGDDLRAVWPTLSDKDKRQRMDDIWEKIIIHPRNIVTGQKVFDPSRVEPVWVS